MTVNNIIYNSEKIKIVEAAKGRQRNASNVYDVEGKHK